MNFWSVKNVKKYYNCINPSLSTFDIGLIHVFEVVNIRKGPKNGLTPECEARGC